jgi:hypothetical protein
LLSTPKVVVDPIKEPLQIDIDHDTVTILNVLLCCKHGVTSTTARTKSVAVLAKSGIDQRKCCKQLAQWLRSATASLRSGRMKGWGQCQANALLAKD